MIYHYKVFRSSGDRKGWGRTITSYNNDPSLSGLRAFSGEFLKAGENRIREGELLVEQEFEGSAKYSRTILVIKQAQKGKVVTLKRFKTKNFESLKEFLQEKLWEMFVFKSRQ